MYSSHLEKNYVLEIKLTDPGFADRSGALQAGSRIGEHTSFLYHHLMEILSSDALQRAKEYGMGNSRAKTNHLQNFSELWAQRNAAGRACTF